MTVNKSETHLKKSLKLLQTKLQILGLESVKIANVDAFLTEAKEKAGNLEFQIFDADTIAGREHLEYAALNALNAFQNGTNLSRSLPVEVILYASGQRQIGKAFKTLGVTPQTRNLALLVLTEQKDKAEKFLKNIQKIVNGKINNNIIENFPKSKLEKLRKFFNISNLEIETLKTSKTKIETTILNLIIEKMALLATQ